MRPRRSRPRSYCKNRYLVTLTLAILARNRGSRAQIHKNSTLFDNFLVNGSLQQPGAAGGTFETGQMSFVKKRQMSQQQSSVLSQHQKSVLCQQKTSILSQQKTRQLPASGRLLLCLLLRQDRCLLLRQDRYLLLRQDR